MSRRVLATGMMLLGLAACQPSDPDISADADSGPADLESFPAFWSTDVSTSMMTDQKDVLMSTMGLPVGGLSSQPIALFVVRCHEGGLNVYVSSREFMSSRAIAVQFRFDEKPAEAADLRVTSDQRGFGWWGEAEALPIVREVQQAERLLVRYTPYGENVREVQFKLAGFGDEFPELAAACNVPVAPDRT